MPKFATLMKAITVIAWATALAAATAACSGGTRHSRCILPAGTELREGDVVLRMGGGATSHAVVAADRGGRYSHVGIVADSCGHPMIVHAVPGEPDFAGDIDRVKLDSPTKFFSTMMATCGAVRRPANRAAAHKAAVWAMAAYRRGTEFDHDYDSADTTRLYCTELVARAYASAGLDIAGPPTHEVNLPGLHTRCWLPSDFGASRRLTTVAEF